MSGFFSRSLARRPLLRGLAAALAFATFAAQLASLVHVASVRHVTCAEHGESVELSGVTDGEGHHHVGSCLRQADDSSAHHDHCDVASFRRERSTPASSLRAAPHVVPPAHALSFACAASDAAHPIDLIRLAPKLPPPHDA